MSEGQEQAESAMSRCRPEASRCWISGLSPGADNGRTTRGLPPHATANSAPSVRVLHDAAKR
eukprot:15432123-Alexandrium_andersonii.AAC.1